MSAAPQRRVVEVRYETLAAIEEARPVVLFAGFEQGRYFVVSRDGVRYQTVKIGSIKTGMVMLHSHLRTNMFLLLTRCRHRAGTGTMLTDAEAFSILRTIDRGRRFCA